MLPYIAYMDPMGKWLGNQNNYQTGWQYV
jgi:hypothetical protein